ncbi:MAG: ABC transporter permease [Candidatus Latescibacteria bacterium]|nr:ABC transporter permease [Candidatus Latescibacterota bacterium]
MNLSFAFREALIGLRRTGSVGIVSAGTLIVSLLLLGAFVLLTANVYGLLRSVRERVEIAVYLKDGVSDERAMQLTRDTARLQGVERATYVDKATAAQEFREAFGGGLLEAVSHNPLPASIRLHLSPDVDPAGVVEGLSVQIQKWPGVEEVDTGLAWVSRLDRLSRIVFAVNGILGLVISLACAFAISNTVQLTVVARREAIEVMRLVGATEGFIRLPFLITGMVQGAAGGVVAALFLVVGYIYGVRLFPELPVRSAASTGGGLVALGLVLGALASLFAVRRVLRTLAWR